MSRMVGRLAIIGIISTGCGLIGVVVWEYFKRGVLLAGWGPDGIRAIEITCVVSLLIGIPLEAYALWACETLSAEKWRRPRKHPPLGLYLFTSLWAASFHGVGLLMLWASGPIHILLYVSAWTACFVLAWIVFCRGRFLRMKFPSDSACRRCG